MVPHLKSVSRRYRVIYVFFSHEAKYIYKCKNNSKNNITLNQRVIVCYVMQTRTFMYSSAMEFSEKKAALIERLFIKHCINLLAGPHFTQTDFYNYIGNEAPQHQDAQSDAPNLFFADGVAIALNASSNTDSQN